MEAPVSPRPGDVDRLAVFVETAEELSREPFFDLYETSRSTQSGGKLLLVEMGDRFHFRSALIPFRRLWRRREDTYFGRILDLIERYEPSKKATLNALRIEHTKLEETRTSWPFKIKLTGKELIDGWLYSVFVHTNLDRRHRKGEDDFDRLKFEEWVKIYGRAALEYAFREVVRRAGLLYFRINEHLAVPLLSQWKTMGFEPRISIAPAFGTARRETMQDGTVVVRRSSTLYGSDETIPQKFRRLLRRFKSLEGTFKSFKMGDKELLKAVVESRKMREMIRAAGFEVHLAEHFVLSGRHKAYEQFINPKTGEMCNVWLEDEGLVVADRSSIRC